MLDTVSRHGVRTQISWENGLPVFRRVQDVRVLRSIPLLDAAAIEAVKQWVYTPTMLNNVPVPVIMTVTVNFTLR